MKLNQIVALFFISFQTLAASETPALPVHIDANRTTYDGKKLILEGEVLVENELGKINARYVELIPSAQNKKTSVDRLLMKDNVSLVLNDGGKLSCQIAEVNYLTREGVFRSENEEAPVIYNDPLDHKSKPLELKCLHMTVTLSNERLNSAEFQANIQTVLAKDHVAIYLPNDLVAYADNAIYKRLIDQSIENGIPGIIVLYADAENKRCALNNNLGDSITATTFTIDTLKRTITCAQPDGNICSRNEKHREQIHFTSDLLTWDNDQQILTLSKHVVVEQPTLGKLTSEGSIEIYQDKESKEKQLKRIESTGESTYLYQDDHQKLHTLHCSGKVTVDHQNLQVLLESPHEENGEILEEKQVRFVDHLGEVFADRISIYYLLNDQSPMPSKIILEGHVRLMNKGENAQKNKHSQFALADTVEYSLEKEELILKSLGKGRVLFFDKLHNLQVSAPSLICKRDGNGSEPSFKGLGDVRFSFLKQELDALTKLINISEKS